MLHHRLANVAPLKDEDVDAAAFGHDLHVDVGPDLDLRVPRDAAAAHVRLARTREEVDVPVDAAQVGTAGGGQRPSRAYGRTAMAVTWRP